MGTSSSRSSCISATSRPAKLACSSTRQTENSARPSMNPDSLKELIRAAVAFRDQRDWSQFHSPKELAISLAVESAELLQIMQWYKGEELQRVVTEKHAHLKDELADVLFSVLLLAD